MALFSERGEEIVYYPTTGEFGVPSATVEDLFYVVDLDAEACECRDSQIRHTTCKHAFAALAYRARHRFAWFMGATGRAADTPPPPLLGRDGEEGGMTLLRIGGQTVNIRNVVRIEEYPPGTFNLSVFGSPRFANHVVVEVVTTGTDHYGYADGSSAPAPHKVEFHKEEAEALLGWLDANATNLTPSTPDDRAWLDYTEHGGDMPRQAWERVRGRLRAVHENLEHADPDSPAWERQMARAGELEAKLGY